MPSFGVKSRPTFCRTERP